MSYCIYLRKSRADAEAEARGEGETLARHERALVELAHRQNLPVTQIYREIVSGDTIAARPEMQQLLADVDAGRWQGALVMEIERLARGDTIDQGVVAQAFKYSNTKIITPIKTFDPTDEFDEEYFEFNLYMSRREYKTISRRQQRGRIASAKEGKFICHTAPYGYQRIKLEKGKGFSLIPDPEKSPIVQQIFQWYTHGIIEPDGSTKRIGVSLIAQRLNELGVPPVKAKTWATASIRDMLINPTYTGLIRIGFRKQSKKAVNGRITVERRRQKPEACELVPGLHMPLVDAETFELAQKYIRANRANPVAASKEVQNPLVGLVICGMCGKRMVRRPYNNREQSPSLMCYNNACPNISSYLDSVEQRVLDSLAAWLTQYKLQLGGGQEEKEDAGAGNLTQLAKKAEQELATLEKQRGSLHDFLERGVYDTETFLARSRVINERLEQVKQALQKLHADMDIEASREEARKTIIPRVEHVLAVYHSLPTPRAKNDMLREVLEKVIYIKTCDGRRNSESPDDYQIQLFPRLPHT